MKHTIISCDLCNDRIYKDGWFHCEHGAISVSAKTLEEFDCVDDVVLFHWKRRRYHICPKCVRKIQSLCKAKED